MKYAVFGLVIALNLSACTVLRHDQSTPSITDALATTIIETEELIIVGDKAMAQQTDAGFCGTVSEHGLCGAAFGMTREALEAAFPIALEASSFDPDEIDCYYMQVAGEERGISFMILNGAFQRLDIYQPTIETELGVKVGMAFTEAEALYPNSFREPNYYTYPAENLIVDIDPEHRLLFVQDIDERVSAIRIGLTNPVNYVEGCL